jgi:Fe-S-cluster containining protein
MLGLDQADPKAGGLLRQETGKQIPLDLRLAGREVHYTVTVPAREARLADLVPPARRLSSRIAETVAEALADEGRTVPCSKGCAACCAYLIPLSVPESICLAEEVTRLPRAERDRVLAGFETACEALGRVTSWRPGRDAESFPSLSRRFASAGLSCPLLTAEGCCSTYAARPVACREHLVTGASSQCGQPGGGRAVEMPASVFEALARVSAEAEGRPLEVVPMPSTVEWWSLNALRARQTWPAEALFGRFVELMGQLVRAA